MVALAAQRTGAGYVQCAVPESAEQSLELRLLEAMTRGLPEQDGAHTEQGADVVAEMAERAGAVVLGPGIGKGDGARAFAHAVARAVDKPLVIDADGLNAFAGELEALRDRPGPTVLTPHAGELGRLLERESAEVEAHRLSAAREAAERSGCVVLLKGDDTIVAAPDGPVAISPGATPALATAGTGDVLAGMIGALLSKGLDPLEAAAAAHPRARARGNRGGRALGRRPRDRGRRDRLDPGGDADMTDVTWTGPPIDDTELLDDLPADLRELLEQDNGWIAYGGALHVRGASKQPEWHSLRWAIDFLGEHYDSFEPGDVPFAQDSHRRPAAPSRRPGACCWRPSTTS